MQRTTFFLACLFICATLVAQQYPFVHYTPREGLANNRVRFVFQDSRGKLYISTYGGLSIYDGTRFTNYNTNNGLAASLVNAIVEMGEDSIWIMPNANRINCLVNGRLKDFVTDDNYIPIINQLVKCSDGYFYALADEGLFRLEGRKFKKIGLNWFQKNNDAAGLVAGAELHDKLVILANPGFLSPFGIHLFIYDLKQKKILAYKTHVEATSIINYQGKEIWLPTTRGTFKIDDRSIQNDSIILEPLPDKYHIPKKLIPQFIYFDRQHNTWLATHEGVYRINLAGETTRFTVESGLSTNVQNSIFQDFENNMWFTNEQTGLCKLPNQQLVYYPEITPGFTASDIFINPLTDSVWFLDAYQNRVLLMLPGRQPLELLYKGPGIGNLKLVSGYGRYILRGNSIFSWHADPVAGNFTLTHRYTDPDSGKGWEYLFGIVDKKENLIVVSDKLQVFSGYNIMSETLDYFTDQVTVDRSGRIWAATRGNKLRCYRINKSRGKEPKLEMLQTYDKELPFMSPRSIIADQDGNIWIGTRDHGLAFLQVNGLTLQSTKLLTTQDGLSDNFVSHLFCDNENNIWTCTPSGLDRIRRVNGRFFVENITQQNNLYFPISKIQQTSEGKMWILTKTGVLTYNPSDRNPGNWKPHLQFADVIIGNSHEQAIKSGARLPHFKNNLNFQLSAPSFINEKQTRFSFLLEGSGNESWSEPSTNVSINFVNLPHGSYTLKAKAIFLHGLYPDATSSFSFTILPPWWQTWWFKLLVAIFLLGSALLGLRYYIKRKLELQRVILEKKQAIEKERTRIATDMHDDLGAGLSRIKFLSETIGLKKQQHLPIENEIVSIRTYSHDMIDKMGEIVWALNEKNDTLSDLLSYTRVYAVGYLEQNGIACHVDEPDNIPQREVSGEFRRNIYLTVKEALHNIVKHAQATDVFIIFDITPDSLHIQIRDNGKGIDKVHNRLYGNGLINMNKRIQELRGQFEIESSNGTLIDFRVPLTV